MKSQVILYIYDVLVSKRVIKIENILNDFNISVRTFRRYISEINAFLCNNYKNQVVAYDVINKYYYLKDERI